MRSGNQNLTVCVTGLNAADSPAPGVAVLRSLCESPLKLRNIGIAYGVLDAGNYMADLVNACYLAPYPNTGPQALLTRISEIHKQEKIDVILPTLDSELDNYIQIESELRYLGIRMLLPQKDSLAMRDKPTLSEKIPADIVKTPQTLRVSDVAALREACENLGFPLLVKGQYYEAYAAHAPEEAVGWFYKLASQWGIPVIAQKMIRGEECNVAGIAKRGKLYGAVAMKKLFLTDKGKAWSGVTIRNEKILDITRRLIRLLNWDGGFELEFIVENGSDEISLIEMNPRFPAWIYLATAAGINMPAMNIALAMGRNIEPCSDYKVGMVFVRHSRDEIVPMQQIESLSTAGQVSHRTASREVA
ncbi:MAG: ATP-grasp domain-containing protein [Leptospiraceae bacterium]|nr:ATP-grasp domain-containing protein [Leptospiraceae bacterium]